MQIPTTISHEPWSTHVRTSTLVRGDVYAVDVDGETVYSVEVVRLIDNLSIYADTTRTMLAARLLAGEMCQRLHLEMVSTVQGRYAI